MAQSKTRDDQFFAGPVEFARKVTMGGALVRTGRQIVIPALNSQVGATAGWAITGVDDGIVRLPAAQTNATLVVPLTGLHIGDTLTSVSVVGQVESAGGNVTWVLSVRKGVAAIADFTDEELGTGNVGTLSVDTLITSAGTPLEVTGLAEVLSEGEYLYALLTGTTAAVTDIAMANLLATYVSS